MKITVLSMFLAVVSCFMASAENYRASLGEVAAMLEKSHTGDTIFVKDGVYGNLSLR